VPRHWSPRTRHLATTRTGRIDVRGPEDPASVRSLWVVLHGYGQLARDFLGGFEAIDDGTRLFVAPEALSRFYDTGGSRGSHSEARVGASWMTREDREREIEDTLGWLGRAHAVIAGELNASVPLTVLGFSQGAAAASRWVARGSVRPARLICWGAGIAPELALDAESPLGRTACTVVVGTRDQFVPADRVEAERARLAAAGHPARFVSFEGGHRLDHETLRMLAAEE
jgi:predicted esterase